MSFFDDPIEPHVVEHLRRSVTMLAPGQSASIDRERVLALLAELQRLQAEHRRVAEQLRALATELSPRARAHRT